MAKSQSRHAVGSRATRFPRTFATYERVRTSLGVFSKRRKLTPQQLFRNPKHAKAVKLIQTSLYNLFTHLGLPEAKRNEMVRKTLEICKKKVPQSKVEGGLRALYAREGLAEKIGQSLLKRSEKIFGQMGRFVSGKTVLDIGAGDGKVGELVAKKTGKQVALCDVVNYNKSGLSLRTYKEGSKLPYGDKSFDTSLLLTVLHHSVNPLQLLREAERVTKNRLIVIESIHMTEEHRKHNLFLDWFYNRVLHEGVLVPFNFQTPGQWKKTFRRHGWNVTKSIDLGIDQPTVPEHHWLFVLDRGKQRR